jgi:hypothetical protein
MAADYSLYGMKRKVCNVDSCKSSSSVQVISAFRNFKQMLNLFLSSELLLHASHAALQIEFHKN